MGCWSESCALSGLEISYTDEVYVVGINEKRERFKEIEENQG